MTRFTHAVLTTLSVAALPVPVLAETLPRESGEAYVLTRTADEGLRTTSEGTPNSRVTAGSYATSLQFTNESGDTSVSLALSFDLRGYKPIKRSDGFYSVSALKLGVTATAPIETSGKDAALFQGDSFVSGSKLRLSLSRYSTIVGSGAGSGPAIKSAFIRCTSTAGNNWIESQPNPNEASANESAFLGKIISEISGGNDNIDLAIAMHRAAGGDPDYRSKPIAKQIYNQCHPGPDRQFANVGELVDEYGPNPSEFRRRFLPKDAKLTFMGLDASMGRDDHSFLDRTNFELLSEPRTTWEVGAYYGVIGSDLSWSLRGRAVYGQSYKDNDEAEICRSVSIPVGGTDCIKGPDGAPIRERTGLVSVEGRKLVTVNDKTQIALAPQVTYRFEDKNVGVEVPIYLVPDEKGKLSGGIKAVYNSKGDEFAVGLFVGVPFSIFFDG